MKSGLLANKLQSMRLPWSPTVYKVVLVSLVALAFAIPLALAAIPFIEFFNGMAAQPKAKAQMTYGRVHGEEIPTQRPLAAGTVPRDYEVYPFEHLGNTPEDARLAGAGLENPVVRSLAHMHRGQEFYNIYCIVCHGREGTGDGPVVGPDRFPAPPSLHTDQARGYADGTIYHMITKGLGKMPSYADKLAPEDRWKVVHYLRALQRAMNPQPEDVER